MPDKIKQYQEIAAGSTGMNRLICNMDVVAEQADLTSANSNLSMTLVRCG